MSGLWCIPLSPTVQQDQVNNVNIDTVLVNKPTTEFLPNQPPPKEAFFNVYEMKMQPELIMCYHVSVGHPPKLTWLQSIKNNNYASWTGLTYANASNHFP